MPPRPKFTKEEVIDAAYALTEEKGVEHITAREIGKRLNTTPMPIFTYFTGMEELKEAVYQRALADSTAYIRECLHYFPAFKEFGLRWIRYAYEHPNIYRMVYLMEGIQRPTIGFVNRDFIEVLNPMVSEVMKNFELSEEEAKTLVNEMCLHAQGIATVCVQDSRNYDEAKISESLGQVCLSLVMGFRIRNGTINVRQASEMLLHTGDFPCFIG